KLEMGMRVYKAGHDRHIAQINVLPPLDPTRRLAFGPTRDDAIAIDRDPAVADRRPGNRNNPGGVIADHCNRVDLPVRLRGGYKRSSAGTDASPSARAVASSSIRGTSRSRKMGSPRIR